MSKTKRTRIAVGVCGGIASYKSYDIVSKLVKMDYDVHVIMTENAKHFVGETTFYSLTGNRVITSLFDKNNDDPHAHIEMGKSDFFVVIAATTNFLGKLANGICDDALLSSIMATDSPVIIAPAMNTKMYNHKATQRNLEILESYGYHIIEPQYGKLACGDIGKGKLASVDTIMDHIDYIFNKNDKFKDKKVVITLGGTKNPIDPVRFISNPSTGKMGMAFARAFRNAGAKVLAISANRDIEKIHNVEILYATSTDEMYKTVLENIADADIFVSAAAVGDLKLEKVFDQKIKKENFDGVLNVVRTVDILKEVAKLDRVLTVGFAAETENIEQNGRKKLESKNLDYIVINDVSRKDIGFTSDDNEVILLSKKHKYELDKDSKIEIAKKVIQKIYEENL